MATAAEALSPRQRAQLRKQELILERSSWISHYRELSQFQQPRLGRFLVTDNNKGNKRHNSIYDRTPLGASRTLAAGMMSGMTSPARPWFRLTLADRDLLEYGPVKTWLHRVGVLLREIFSRSNTYNALHQGYFELGLFGTWATAVVPNFDTVLHHHSMTAGEYALGIGEDGRVNTLVREYQMTVRQLVERFGRNGVSQTVRNLYDRNHWHAWVPVTHMIEPNEAADPRKADAKSMRFASKYWETNANVSDGFLSESGYKRFVALAPRWDVTGNDVYGTSPGMEVLGTVKQLQQEQLRKGQGIDYKTMPPLQVPTTLRNDPQARLPGGVYYYDQMNPAGGVRSAFEVNLDLSHLLEDIRDVREQIREAYYADLFLMLANDTRSGVTATEVAERHEEKLLMLGPVLERLHNELLSPKIDLAFDYASDAGILPPAPPELEGMDLNIEFVSTLAQAQRMVSAQGMDRLFGTIGQIAALFPQVVHKVNALQAIDDYADMFGVNPELIVPDDVVQKRVAAEQQAKAAQQAAAAAPVMADTAKTAGDTNVQGLRDVMNMVQGYSSPSPSEVS